MYFEGELPVVTTGNSNNGMWGSDGIWAILLLALLGNRGFGFGGNAGYGANGEGAFGYQLGKLATTNDVASGFSTSEIMSDLNGIQLANAQGFAGLNSAISNATSTLGYNMLQGFHGVDNAICTLGYQNQQGFNALGHQISDCCCATQRLIERTTCDILQSNTANTQRIIDYLTNEKISSLQAENVALKGRISNDQQSAYLLDKLAPCPRPAYITCNPQTGLTYPQGYGCCGCTNIQ